jgi:hypothetical protein
MSFFQGVFSDVNVIELFSSSSLMMKPNGTNGTNWQASLASGLYYKTFRIVIYDRKLRSGLYYKTITIVIMTIVSDATVWSIAYNRN